MRMRHREIESVLILVIINVIVNLILEFIFHYEFGYLNLHNQAIYCCIAYICVAKLFSIRHRYGVAITLGHVFFLIDCALLYYSKTLVDYIMLGMSMYTIVNTIMLKQCELNDFKKEELV